MRPATASPLHCGWLCGIVSPQTLGMVLVDAGADSVRASAHGSDTLDIGVQVKVAVVRKADALIEAGSEGGERLRLHRAPLEAFSTVYSFCAALAGYEGPKWHLFTTKEAEDQVLSLRDGNGMTVMHWAADDDSRAKLVGVIAARESGLVHAKDRNGSTALHRAVMHGREAVARVLLAAGADKHAPNRRGQTPLHLAQEKGHAALVALLS